MDRNTQKEEFSYAYIQAVASVAGYTVELKRRAMDNAGVDVTIEVPGEIGETLFPKFDAQVKCTASQNIFHSSYIKFPLEIKNYQKLRHENPLTPQLLIVVLVPADVNGWMNISEEETLMKKCGYWISLKGRPITNNTTTITIDIPRTNLFTPSALSLIMSKIDLREDL
ncbi:DUF4365 domain-containing protein [Nodularia sp. LEGE 06071]|nr:DUF4365 domain-containing protein [Nodularia sp. LEGE 06071]MCC2692603.1 DUF4365 domain-containing protein [Nodularia sp. LEGE 04288]